VQYEAGTGFQVFPQYVQRETYGAMILKREPIRELWRYRELFLFFVWRDFKVRYKQSLLGAAWAVLQPFGAMVVFTVFFHKFAQIPSDGVPYPIFSYSALLPWTYFSGVVTQGGNSLVGNKHLVTKVYFPRITLPAATAIRGLVDFSIATVILFGMMAYYGFAVSWGILLWPVLLFFLATLALAVGMFFAALNVRYRDVQHILPFFIQIWLFVTPIIYPARTIPEGWQKILALNPLMGIIEAFRATIIPGREIDMQLLAISLGVTGIIFLASTFYFRKAAREFADII
jgi:lipopolysaccharide transport system permease protein